MNFVTAIFVILYVSLAGYGLLKLVLRGERPFSILGEIPIAFVLGFGVLGWWGNFIMLLRLKLSFGLSALPLLPPFVYAIYEIVKSFKAADKPDWRMILAKGKKIGALNYFFLAVIVFAIVSVVLMSLIFPLHFWDSRAIWGLKAKMLFGDGTVFSINFLDPDRIQPHFRYPLLFPLAQVFIYQALGAIDDWAVMALVALFFPLTLIFLFDLLRLAFRSFDKAAFGAAVLAVLPLYYFIDGPAHSGYADVPLGLFFLVSFGCLYLWQINRTQQSLGTQKLFLLGVILSGFLPLVKNEGALVMLLNLFWLVWPEDMKNWGGYFKRIIVFGLIVAAIFLPWVLLRNNIPDVQDERYLDHLRVNEMITNLNRLPAIANFYFRAFLGLQTSLLGVGFLWGGLWGLFFLAGVKCFLERNLINIRIFLSVLLFCFLMGVIFLVAPVEGKFDTSGMVGNFFRVMVSITPLLVILAIKQCDFPFSVVNSKIVRKAKIK